MVDERSLDRTDPWQARLAIAQTSENLAPIFSEEVTVPFFNFLVKEEALGDRSAEVRRGMLNAGSAVIDYHGSRHLAELITMFETHLAGPPLTSEAADFIQEAVVISFGRVARHLDSSDARLPTILARLVESLKTPSEQVQYAVADCLAPLVKASPSFVIGGSNAKLSVIVAFGSGTPMYTCQWLVEAPGTSSFSPLASSFSCSAGSLFSTSSGNLFKAGTWSFELQVSDSGGAVVKSAPTQVSVSPPAILLSPSSSSKAGTRVYVSGLGFVSGSKVTVRFNGVSVATCVARKFGLLLNCSFKVPSGRVVMAADLALKP